MTNDYGNLELHQVLLRAMKDIDEICRNNGLKYYLYAGTLLGAVNHKGFIPWDDDVDLVMFPDDFAKLCSILEQQFPDHYRMLTFDNAPERYSMMNKLQVLGTSINYNTGEYSPIFVDINVLHSVPDGKILRWIHEQCVKFLNMGLYVLSGEIVPSSWKAKITIGLLAKAGKLRLGYWLRRIMAQYDHLKTNKVGILCNTLTTNPYTGRSGYMTDLTIRKDHECPLDIKFEDTYFMTISNYEAYLAYQYGPHYMDPYPEEKRITKHDVKAYSIAPWVRERCQ